MGHIQDQLPKRVLDVAHWGPKPLAKIHRTALRCQLVEHLSELLVRLPILIHALAADKEVRLIVTVERPMVLIKAPEGHSAPTIDLYRLHVQVLEWLFNHFGTILVQSVE